MENELETLKNLIEPLSTLSMEVDGIKEPQCVVLVKKLRQEAIKWIKELEKEEGSILIDNELTINMPNINLDDGNMIIQNIIYSPEDRIKIAVFLKFINNITEEDLK